MSTFFNDLGCFSSFTTFLKVLHECNVLLFFGMHKCQKTLSYAQAKSMPSSLPLLQGTSLCSSLRHTLHTLKKFRQKFSLSYIYTSSK